MLLSALVVTSLGLIACSNEEDVELEEGVTEEFVEEEGIEEEDKEDDFEEYRIDGDRLRERPVLDDVEREKRAIKQYELVDRPVIMNTIKYIHEFDGKYEDAFQGIRNITSNLKEEARKNKAAEYREHLKGGLPEEVSQIYDIRVEFPYADEEFNSYYREVVSGLEEEVFRRTKVYSEIEKSLDKEEVGYLGRARLPQMLVKIAENKESTAERYRPFIVEMDKLVKEKKEELGMEEVEYSKVDEEVEDVANYIVPERVTLYEIKEQEIEDNFYKEMEKELDEENESDE